MSKTIFKDAEGNIHFGLNAPAILNCKKPGRKKGSVFALFLYWWYKE
ncbi:MAG: hypothetical protein Q8P74_00785 [bacterium]|nr:hypothetical protein [bacterium]